MDFELFAESMGLAVETFLDFSFFLLRDSHTIFHLIFLEFDGKLLNN